MTNVSNGGFKLGPGLIFSIPFQLCYKKILLFYELLTFTQIQYYTEPKTQKGLAKG